MVQMWKKSSGLAFTCFSLIVLLTVCTEGAPKRKCEMDADPDACRNVTEIIRSKGYPVEEHVVLTKDGYVLNIQRIPYGRRGPGMYRRPVVFLQHGLFDASVDWVINMPHQSLGYILADAGYDVWLGNVRGNDFSSHVKYSKTSSEFWDFCFDDMIAFDLPAMIDYVLFKTRRKKLFYVGHSQGTLLLFGLLSDRPVYNRKIILFSALAPVTSITHLTSPFRLILPFAAITRRLLARLGMYDVFRACEFTKWLRKTICKSEIAKRLVLEPVYFLSGMEAHRYNMSRMGVVASHLPSGTSLKNVVHYGQLLRCKRFRKFNYGLLKNKRIYGQWTPPEYDVSRVTAPVAIYWSMNDWMADPKDIRLLAHTLPNVVLTYQVADPDFSHVDFTLSVLARRYVYPALLTTMNAFRFRAQ